MIVLGCSTSEVAGARIGKGSVPELGEVIAEAMLAACRRFRIPAPTRPTVRTMVAVELWMMAVTMVPVSRPITVFWVSLPRKFFSAVPEQSFRPSPITSIP